MKISNDILQKLMTQETGPDKRDDPSRAKHHLTSLGVPLHPAGENAFTIDMTDVGVFAGISTIARMLANDVIDHCGRGISDIMVQHKLLPQLTPQLCAAGVEWIMVYARLEAVEDLPAHHREFNDAIERIFHSIQSPRWQEVLFSTPGRKKGSEQKIALLFPFYQSGNRDYFILVEYERTGRFLRITFENANLSRVFLKHVPHRVVDNLDRYYLIPDLGQTAHHIYQGIIKEASQGTLEFKETFEHHPILFNAIREGGLERLDTMIFHWPFSELATLVGEEKNDHTEGTKFLELINKDLLILQDHDVIHHLNRGATIELTDGEWRVFFELSRRSSCLHISWQETRSYAALGDYLDRMPALKETTATVRPPLPQVQLMLVHHITAETLGFIGACRDVGFKGIDTFFVTYSGVVPDDYMETILSQPEEDYRFHSLQRIETASSVRGAYQLSRQYSSIDELRALDTVLAGSDYSFFEAARMAAGHLFMRKAARVYRQGAKMLLVEDGGYVSPLINGFCLEGRTLREALDRFHVDPEGLGLPTQLLEGRLSDWLAPLLMGAVEHTRNGYDANLDVENRYGRLQFPVCSIAISDLKRGPEAQECAIAILNATENIMHRLGLLLSRRQALVLGSRGAIGRCALVELAHRLGPHRVAGVDITTPDTAETPLEVTTIEQIPKDLLYDADLFVGIIGKSIITRHTLEDLMVHSRRDRIFFASGSTKTTEFNDLEDWLVTLQREDNPVIAGHEVSIEHTPLRDLQTRVTQGQIVKIQFKDKSIPDKTLYLLGNLTPINFLYYGIPREIVDEVLSQLLRVSVGLAQQTLQKRLLPGRLLAVDHEIDADALLLKG